MTISTTTALELDHDITGEGDPVLLIHGGWSDRHNWQLVAPELARSFCVIVPDRRGHGLSPRGIPGTRRDQEDDIARLIEDVGLGPVHLVGTSFGGSIAVGLATRRPELVRTLVVHEPPLTELVAPGHEARPELDAALAALDAVLARAERGDAAGAAEQFAEEVALGPGAWALLPDSLREVMVEGAEAIVLEQRDPDWASIDRAALASIDCPTAITRGDASLPWFDPIVGELGAAIDVAGIHTYPGAGHAPHLTNPGDWLGHVTAFLTTEGASR